jgi:hypothetical protein
MTPEPRMAKPIARVLIAVVLAAAAVAAQTKPASTAKPTPKPAAKPASKPNFTGHWVVVSPQAKAGQEQIVTQDDKTLTTEHAVKGSTRKIVYQLDGIERQQAIPSSSVDVTMRSRASWEADHIVIAIDISYSNGMKTQTKETWSIDAQGRLVIDGTETGPQGSAGPVDNTKIIYVKKK